MDLKHAEVHRLGKHPSPGQSVELIRTRLESDWVRKIGTTQRTAMGELGQKPKWMRYRFTHRG
jgi:hypothetical protein